MLKVHRRVGKLLPRTADEAQVSVLLKDYEDADKMLAKIIEGAKAWRDAWVSILGTQARLVDEFKAIYNPIVGASEGYSAHDPAETPQDTIERTEKLSIAFEELKTDLLEEVSNVDSKIIRPATDAKEYIQSMKKVIKKREGKKLDFERYQKRVESGRKKMTRSDKENAALAKAETDLTRCKEEYEEADDHLKSNLPGIITAVFSILPPLLETQIIIQNTLLAQYYTTVVGYCEDSYFPSPPPPMREIIDVWDQQLSPVRQQVETDLAMISTGKAVRKPMKQEDLNRGHTMTGLNIRNGIRDRKTSGHKPPPPRPAITAAAHHSEPRLAITAAPHRKDERRPSKGRTPSPANSTTLITTPTYSEPVSPSSGYLSPGSGAFSPAAPRTDYFAKDRQPSSSSISSVIAAKKKPPPPPPSKKPGLGAQYVTALYSFDGQGEGDLAFNEGDKIMVVKKTDSQQDWWEGELRGHRGAFPANYCRAA